MKLSIVISVLESYEVVARQILHFKESMSCFFINDELEIIIVDDGSNPSIINPLKKDNYLYDAKFIDQGFIKDPWSNNILPRTKIEFKDFSVTILESLDTRPWTQPLGRNRGACIAKGEVLLFTDIDHILTYDAARDSIFETFDKMEFPRTWAILSETGNIVRDKNILMEYGCKEHDLEKVSSHYNTFAIRKSLFDRLGGYDIKFCGKYGGDDVDFCNRYSNLVKAGEAQRSIKGSMIYVYPDPRKDVKHVFHSLR